MRVHAYVHVSCVCVFLIELKIYIMIFFFLQKLTVDENHKDTPGDGKPCMIPPLVTLPEVLC